MTEYTTLHILDIIHIYDRLKKLYCGIIALLLSNCIILISNTLWHYADIMVCIANLIIITILASGVVSAHKNSKKLRSKLNDTFKHHG